MMPRSLKTGARAQGTASFFIALKTGEVLELTIYGGKPMAAAKWMHNTERPRKAEMVSGFLQASAGLRVITVITSGMRCACIAAVNTCTQVRDYLSTVDRCPFQGAPKALRANAASVTCTVTQQLRNGWTRVGEPFQEARILGISQDGTRDASCFSTRWLAVESDCTHVTQRHARSRGVTAPPVASDLRSAPPCYEHARRMPLARLWQSHGSAMAHAIQTHPKPEAAS